MTTHAKNEVKKGACRVSSDARTSTWVAFVPRASRRARPLFCSAAPGALDRGVRTALAGRPDRLSGMPRKRTKKTRAVKADGAVGLAQALQSLPLFTDTYLNMQAINLDLIDQFIEHQETRLLHEYFEKERTPLPSTMFVSALCQLWIFGLYELL